MTGFSVSDFFISAETTAEDTSISSAFDLNLFNSLNSTNSAGVYIYSILIVLYTLLGIYVNKLDNKSYSTIGFADSIDMKDNPNEQITSRIRKVYEEKTTANTNLRSTIFTDNNGIESPNLEEEKNEEDIKIEEERTDHREKNIENIERANKSIKEGGGVEEDIDKSIEKLNVSLSIVEIKEDKKKVEKDDGIESKDEKDYESLIKSSSLQENHKQTIKELILESHEIFRLIYRPIKTETRFGCLTILFTKILTQMFLVGLFYQSKATATAIANASSPGAIDIISTYSLADFWISVYSAVISLIIFTFCAFLINYPESLIDHYSTNFRSVSWKIKLRRRIGYFIAWGIMAFTGWCIILFSIKFSIETRTIWILGTAIGAIVEICLISLIKEIGLI